MPTSGLKLDELVHPNEKPRFAMMAGVSVLIYGALIFEAWSTPALGLPIIFYGPLLVLAAFLAHGLAVGRVRGNGILVSERQFPLLHRCVVAHASRLGIDPLPSVYVLEAGGVLNAFAMKLLGKKFVVIN